MRGLAVDFRDQDGALRNWCLANLALLHRNGVWLEDFKWTPTWVHMQIVAPGSGKRIYPPRKSGAMVSNWDGKYDGRFDGHIHSYSGA